MVQMELLCPLFFLVKMQTHCQTSSLGRTVFFCFKYMTTCHNVLYQYAPTMTASTSLDGLLSVTKKLIIPSDLMRRLQPKKNMPNTTVRDNTHITAIWTTLIINRLLSSGNAATKPLSVTTDEKLQQKISSVLLNSPLSVWLNPVEFISTFQLSIVTAILSQLKQNLVKSERNFSQVQ